MITKDNLRDVLFALEFNYNKTADTYYRAFIGNKCEIRVDFKDQSISYPESEGFKVYDRTTCNFEHPENFVVLECVCRLLEKGYHPKHIELETRWNLGHMPKGGKADICIRNKDGKEMLMIIECKTFGMKYNEELKNLKEDGGQLFTYWQQERSTQWIALYTSDYQDRAVIYENTIIHCNDDAEVRKLAKKDKSLKLYDNARTVQDLFEVWDKTYDKRILNKGVIFGEESSAYQIGIPPLRKKHLVNFRPEDKIVNRFEEILRHNNVSDKENAFNRLIALFICKLVDEIQKNDDDVVEFQYKMGETYESLQDRLQRLHQEGMEKFMREEIYYIPDDYAERLFANRLNDKKRKAAIEDLQNTIRILKFYSNNDFAFKDVHNEQLFYQNGKVLVEVVELFQGYRIVYPSKQQFLGDLFEQLLNKGFKQNEGQFFTPMPITRFIWDCLPLEKIIVSKSGFKFPKVIDYACGAGHFLTEGIEAINEFFQYKGQAKRIDNNAWVEHSIFGVEKDYRLARVAKVSLYMNGAGLGNIKFGDGLKTYPEEEIKNGSFDILVANPPYSVSGFRIHLDVKDEDFNLLKRKLISNDASEIETLFVERISQLLKPCGIAAVILPSSILSNENGSYIGAREILLQNFYLRGITQFGGKTFGATNTNTVVLFLEKYDEPPKKKEIIKDSVNAILSGKIEDDWNDKEIFKAYIEKINVDESLYKSFISEKISVDLLKSNEYFAQYVEWFEKDKSQKKKCNQRDLLKAIKEKEREKLFYFSLIYNQTTVVISAPADNNEQKKFLGYDWSNRKGAEGIQINQPGGMLYNDSNRYADNTLAAALQSSFSEKKIFLPENLEKYYAILRTQDMIDFSRVAFNKALKPSVKGVISITYKYPAKNIEQLLVNISGNRTKIEQNEILAEGKYPVVTQETDKIISGYTNNPNYISDLPIIVFGDHSCTFKYIDFPFIRGADGTQLLKVNEEEVLTKFLYYFLSTIQIENADKYERHFKYLKTTKTPVPPHNIQQQIVSECEKIDEKYKATESQIISLKNKIYQIIDGIQGQTKKLQEICIAINPSKTDIRDISDDTAVSFVEMASVSNDGFIEKSTDKSLGELRKGSYTYFAENDIIIAKITPCMENGKCAIARNLTNRIGMGSSEFHVFRIGESCLTKYVFAYLNRDIIRQSAEKCMTGASGHRRVPIDFYENLRIPIPPLYEQKQIVSKIEQYEKQIVQAKAIMAECPAKKKAILKNYLE